MEHDYYSMRLHKVEELLNNICSGVYQFDLRGVKTRAAITAASKIRENPSYNKPIGVWVKNLLEADNKITPLTPAAIATWFKEGGRFTASLLANWNTPSDLILDLAEASKEWNSLQKKANIDRSERNSEATLAILKTDETKSKEYQLYGNWNTADEKISQPDIDFLYSHLRQDSMKNLYWVFDNGTVLSIPLSEGSAARKILDDADFWSLFCKENMPRIKDYCKTIVDRCYELRNNILSTEEDMPTIEEELEGVVPHCISRNVCVQIHFRKTGSGKNATWLFDHFSLAMNAQKQALNRTNWCSVLQVDMIKFLDFSKIAFIAQWTDNAGVNAIYHSPFNPIIRNVAKMPMLPPTFASFFRGKLTNPLMGLLRIAVFMKSVLDPNDFSRQALVLVGLGKEGKGVFCKFLERAIGEACVTLQENAFDRENRFGMVPAINKRLIILQDIKQPSSVIESPMFKSVTGNDTLSIDRKFQNAMEWRVHGTKLILVTNKKIWLNNMYSVSRVLPLFFKRNYDIKDAMSVMDLTDKMLLEKNEFIQWCYDYVSYYSNIVNKAGKQYNCITKNGLLVMNDQTFKKWVTGDDSDIDVNQMQVDAFEAETPEDMFEPMFKVKTYESENDDDVDNFMKIFNRLFVKDPNNKMRSSDISATLVSGTKFDYPEMILVGLTRQTTSNGHCDAIRNFKAWLITNGITKNRVHGVDYFIGIGEKKQLAELEKQDTGVMEIPGITARRSMI
jgi:hypothetical protein